MSLYHQLKQRHVLRVGAAYLAVAWLLLQILDVVQDILLLPDWVARYAFFALLIGFPVTLILAWVYQLTPQGVKSMADAGEPMKSTPFGSRKIDFLIMGALLLIIVVLIVDNYMVRTGRPVADEGPPVVSAVTQLTKSQLILPPVTSEYPMVIDGTRIYFSDWETNRLDVLEVSTIGGEAVRVPPLVDERVWVRPLAMAPEGAQMLIASFDPKEEDWWDTLWLSPIVGGSPRRLASGYDGVFSTDGQQVFYLSFSSEFSDGVSDLFLANADFSDSVKLGTTPGVTHWPHFSPNGSRIRFHFSTAKNPNSIWEISTDGTDLHPILPEWELTPHCCGSWTPDGKFYVFQATRDGSTQLWAYREKEGGPSGADLTPVQITRGALDLQRPTLVEGGRKIFAMSWQLRGEVAQYNHEAESFVSIPELGSLSAEWLSWSRDQEQLAYVSFPDAGLWRSMHDGSNRLQLTYPPMRVADPQWSPDGRSIAFSGKLPGEFWKIFIVSADGGSARPITDEDRYEASPTWSPDGATLAFSAANKNKIQLLEVATGNVSDLAGSDGLRLPQWSFDGNHIAVKSKGSLKLFDVSTGLVETLVENVRMDGFYWAESNQNLYYHDWVWAAPDRAVYRVNVEDKTVQKIARIGNVKSAWGTRGVWAGVSPDGTPLIMRDLGIHHIYALDWLPE